MLILLVDDDKAVRITLQHALEEAGHAVAAVPDGEAALLELARQRYDLLLTDVRLPGVDGVSVFRRLRRIQPDAATILMTAYADTDAAVAVMREGAEDYIAKPFDFDELLLRLDAVAERLRVTRELAAGSPALADPSSFVRRELVGASPLIQLLRQRIEAAAAAGTNVLITGETGTGKEVAAHALHRLGQRATRPFIHINCASIPPDLFEAEMFGHERGAFTGALSRREGRMAIASGGTLFFDEVAELPLDLQGKLLRAIESGRFEAVGSSQVQSVDVWVLAATNRDLPQMIADGRFRQDFYFRLNVIELQIPPLRERAGDVPLLVEHFLRQIAARRGVPVPALTPAATAALSSYDYPGNVRELLHALEHGTALARGEPIRLEHLPAAFGAPRPPGPAAAGPLSLADAVREFESVYIQRVLDQRRGKRGEAARALGISRKSLWQKMKR